MEYTHAHVYVSTHVHKVLSLSFSRNSVSNYAGFGTLILEYFNYSIERRSRSANGVFPTTLKEGVGIRRGCRH